MNELLAWGWLFTVPGLLLTALGVPGSERRAGWASVPGPVVLLVVAGASLATRAAPVAVEYPNWLPFVSDGAFRLLVDTLSAALLAVLGFVATCVYVYSLGYMADDPGRRRFFVFLDLFVAAMALLLLAGNLVVLLIGWTGVGVVSFLLISFWRDRPGTLGAGLQALAANAIGDGALLLAAVLVPTGCGALVGLSAPRCIGGPGGAELLALLLFVAAAAKSAQGPLYFWLPSAMAGPTPISALIHAATMVAAGVYLLVRTHALLALAPTVGLLIAVIGVATALLASVGSLRQTNFKRGIAYSTIAQLGYMFAAIGVGAPFAAAFHLVTHAAFKALLFLSAGVVIHGANGEERLDRLSGRGRHFRASYWGFFIGSLALIGTPLITSGSFSKDLIIDAALHRQPVVGYLLLAGVLLTGLYTGRLFFRVYHGPETADGAQVHHDPPSERLMNAGLVPLMIGAIAAGWLAWPFEWLPNLLTPTVGGIEGINPLSLTGVGAFALALTGFLVAGWLARRPLAVSPDTAEPGAAGWVRLIASAGDGVADAVAALHAGRLHRYAMASLLALAVVLLVSVGLR